MGGSSRQRAHSGVGGVPEGGGVPGQAAHILIATLHLGGQQEGRGAHAASAKGQSNRMSNHAAYMGDTGRRPKEPMGCAHHWQQAVCTMGERHHCAHR
jgi:hypothetical protein